MKLTLRFLLSMALCVPLVAQPDTLTILHVNDSHSNLLPLAPRNQDLSGQHGGIARIASLVGLTRMTELNVLFLHGGDLSIGDPMYNMFFGVPEYAILSMLGLDAMAVGNHEFDLTPSTLLTALDTAATQGLSFPLLSANLILDDPAVSPLNTYISPHTVKTVGSVKVGIFGMTTPETNVLSLPGPAVVDTNLGPIAGAEVATLVADTCDVIILLSHLGYYYDRLVAENVPGINVIVGGHDHLLLTQPDPVVNPTGDTTWIVQAGAFYEHVGKLKLLVDGATVRPIDYTSVLIDETIPEEPQVKAIVDQLAADEEAAFGVAFFSEQVGVAEEFQTEVITDLMTRHEAGTNVARLITRAFKAAIPSCDLAITACGATAQAIQAGPVTAADLFRAIGYGFNEDNYLGYRLSAFTLSGLDLMAGLEFGLGTIELNDEFFIVGEHMRYYYDPSKKSPGRLDSVFVDGEPIDPARDYRIVGSEFILAFLKDYVAGETGITVKDDTTFAITEFEALLGFVSTIWTITDVQTPDGVSEIPVAYALEQNFPNPFNPSTTIRFSLPHTAYVQLSVFDMLGRRVEMLLQDERKPGQHSVIWHADVPSGVYFYRLHASDERGETIFDRTRKMVLLR